jgi:hypothetical protein
MIDVCGSCGQIGYLPDGVICEECEEVYWTGPEEASFIRSNIIARQSAPLSDPWDKVEA